MDMRLLGQPMPVTVNWKYIELDNIKLTQSAAQFREYVRMNTDSTEVLFM